MHSPNKIIHLNEDDFLILFETSIKHINNFPIVQALDIEKGDAIEFTITSGQIKDGKVLDPKIEFKKVKEKKKKE